MLNAAAVFTRRLMTERGTVPHTCKFPKPTVITATNAQGSEFVVLTRHKFVRPTNS